MSHHGRVKRSAASVSVVLMLASAISACVKDPVAPTGSTLVVRSLRPDTVSSIMKVACDSASTTATNLMASRDRLLPQAEQSFTPTPGCLDLRFLNARDSLLDLRTNVVLTAGDSVIIVLRK